MEDLSLGARKASFQKDCLRLTRDVAQLGLIYQAEAKNERANRAQRVLHMKNQNRVGATAIAQFMDYNIHICAGRPGELEVAADKAGSVVSQMYCKLLALKKTDMSMGVCTQFTVIQIL